MSEEEDVLLLGAESFWKGFDVKGFALFTGDYNQITFLRIPTIHCLKQMRKLQLMEKRLFELTLPNAIIRFRQGIGRLIRSRTDIGELTIFGF